MATTEVPLKNAASQRVTVSPLVMVVTSLLGLGAFFYPFFLPPNPSGENASHSADAPLIFVLLVGLCLLLMLADLETRRLDAKIVALLGLLVATNAALRPVPGPGGFSFIYALPLLGGYVFGGGFGFLLGSLSVLVSALFTAGVGPYLPFQMFALGWVGVAGAGLRGPVVLFGQRAERWVLAVSGFVVGLLFGALMNLWFWPFLGVDGGDPGQLWDPAAGIGGFFSHYLAFYLATSLAYDLPRAFGNFVILLLLGPALLKLLRRFQQRFSFEITSA